MTGSPDHLSHRPDEEPCDGLYSAHADVTPAEQRELDRGAWRILGVIVSVAALAIVTIAWLGGVWG